MLILNIVVGCYWVLFGDGWVGGYSGRGLIYLLGLRATYPLPFKLWVNFRLSS